MTEYRLQSPATMNLWTDDNASVMEAFMNSDLTSLWPPTPLPPPPPPHSSASTSAAEGGATVNQDSLQQRLQALIDGARENWTYAIFWQSSYDFSGASSSSSTVLAWGDGYYKGDEQKGNTTAKSSTRNYTPAEQEHRKKVLRELNSLISGPNSASDDAVDEEVTDTEWFFLVSMTQSFVNGVGLPGQAFFNGSPAWIVGSDRMAAASCERAKQGQVFGLQTMVCIPLQNGVVELGSSELIPQSSDLMNKVRVLFNFSTVDLSTAWPQSNPDQGGENDPSSLWISDLTRTDPPQNGSSYPSSSSLTETPAEIQNQTQGFFTRELNFGNGSFGGNQPKPESGEILNFGDNSSKRSSSNPNLNHHNLNPQLEDNNTNKNKKKKPSPTSRGSNNDEGMLSFTSGVLPLRSPFLTVTTISLHPSDFSSASDSSEMDNSNNNNQQTSFYQFSDQLRLHNSNLANLSLNDSIWSSSSNTNNNPYGSSKRPDERRNFDIRVGAELNSPAPKIGSDWNGFNDGWKVGVGSPAGSMMNNNNNNMNSSFPGLLNNSNSSSVMGGSHQMNVGLNGGFNKGIYSKGGGGFNFNVNPRMGKNGKGIGGDDDHQFGKVGKKNGGKKGNDSNDNGKDGKQNGVDKRFKTLPATEALPRNETIGGYIFVCNNDTMAENLRRQLFGLPPRYRDSVRAITPGLPLFLYNYSTHQLHGVFEAASFGGTNIDPAAWEDKKCAGESRFPAQVKVVTRKICEPLEEDSFRPILHHYDGPKFRLELNVPEALSLLDIFDDQKA